MPIKTLDILRHISSVSLDTQVQCEHDDLFVGRIKVSLDLEEYTKDGYEERVQRLLRSAGLKRVDVPTLESNWNAALKNGPVTISELLELARQSSSRIYGISDELDEWRQRIINLLDRLKILYTDEIPAGDPQELGGDHLELKTLLRSWPKKLLDDPIYACVEPLFDRFPEMPIDSIWVDLNFVDTEELPRDHLEGFIQDATEQHYVRQHRSSCPSDFVLENLRGLVALVGDPGVGKTTLLKWMARKFLKNDPGRYLLPLYIPLTRIIHESL